MLRSLPGILVMFVAQVAVAGPVKTTTLVGPPQKFVANAYPGSTLYLNRCVGGCNVSVGTPNATTDTTDLIPAPISVPEFAWPVGQWEATLACVQQVYSPYNIIVTDVRPASGQYNETIVAGTAAQWNQPPDTGGFARVSTDCTPFMNTVNVVFAEAIDLFAQEDGGSQVFGGCWVIAQESAHSYGLDHEFSFTDAMSACNDPMTYRADCGGQKFFRNKFAKCGEFGPARPACGPSNSCQATQNSHQKMLTLFGPGTVTTTPPEVMITTPAADAMIGNGVTVHAMASAQRGIETMELWINGFKWADASGARFSSMGQLPADYALAIPADVPDSILDIQVKAFDDLLIETDATVTVTKGKAGGCTDAAADCAEGQKCETGRCFWDPPTGEVGDTCTYPQFCKSLDCEGDSTLKICTQPCVPNTADACPNGLDCIASGPTMGVCFLADSGGGCCSVGAPGSMWAHAGFGLFVLAVVLRRRRR